ncbi:MAG: zf-HC2 domain-containing protein [Hydrogenophaga sp.]|uniref:zf-HC2 domain-containing protein n=1 Tax=Hydrogenophaga sp. TaxID=1904254 RepID=UPI001DF0211A|nr:zf-HC2 domain-containing protein [Hydrogenophaga sp.]MBX3610781.1 zf-HC2 domain-containing protein [Hydrogenophaga sp.]
MKPMYPLRRTCKEVTALLIAGEDRELPLMERLALRMHLAMCEACPRIQNQVRVMREAMGAWRRYSDDPLDADDSRSLS